MEDHDAIWRHLGCKKLSYLQWMWRQHLHQQTKETISMYLVVIWPKTMMSFWNMSTASAPIHNTAAIVKYWMSTDMAVQAMSLSVLLIPTRKERSIKNIARQSWTWNLVGSRFRSFLEGNRLSSVSVCVCVCVKERQRGEKEGDSQRAIKVKRS